MLAGGRGGVELEGAGHDLDVVPVVEGLQGELEVTLSDGWSRGYSRERAAFPLAWVRERKFWPAVGRVESAFGDRNLVCSCPPIEEYASA